MIALAGVGMPVHLGEVYEWRVRECRMETAHDLREAIMGRLLGSMWATGTGVDMMKRIAASMVCGMVSSTILTLIVIPVLYSIWRRVQLRSGIPSPVS